jgi:protease I
VNKSVLLILPAREFNEHEFLVIKNALEKARVKIFIASDAHSLCVGSSGLKVKNDIQFYNIHENNFSGIIFIGGKGVKEYWNNTLLHNVTQKFNARRKIIGAICSAVLIPAKAGVIECCATCYIENRKEIEKEGLEYKDENVIVSKNIVTGRDPMSSAEFINSFLFELAKKS